MSDINITYETLYEILRNEKNREDIQELSPTFFTDVISYLNKNKQMLDDAIVRNSNDEEKEDLIRQIKNIKNIIREVYDRRETKVMNLALNFARTGSESIEFESLLQSEKEFYKMCVDTFNVFRKKNLERVLRGSAPSEEVNHHAMMSSGEIVSDNNIDDINEIDADEMMQGAVEVSSEDLDEDLAEDVNEELEESQENQETDKKEDDDEENNDAGSSFANKFKSEEEQASNVLNSKPVTDDSKEKSNEEIIDEANNGTNESEVETKDESEVQTKDESEDSNILKIKFKESVPKFLGKELEVYGPFEAGDEAELPKELANILLKKDKAQEV